MTTITTILTTLLLNHALAANSPTVELYRLKMPDGQKDICQASDLCFGQVGRFHGLWIVPDRNSGRSGNQIFLIDRAKLHALRPGQNAVATHAFPVAGPARGWDRFIADHARIDRAVLTELREQFDNFPNNRTPILDFEGIAIAPHTASKPQTSTTQATPQLNSPPADADLFVVTEQPHSLVLEFSLIDDGPARLSLVDCFDYPEKPEDRGGDANDGIEGIAWAGKPHQFFIGEEGTRPFRPGDTLHFFNQPRLMHCTLADGRCRITEPGSTQTTESVRARRGPPSQSLNALTRADDHTLLAVDRNGGWILAVDTATGHARRWISLYDPTGLNLRERLDRFPRPRHMPYVSIEGIAIDDRGDLWLCDDPAMPEGFRESALIRAKNLPPLKK